MAVNATVHRCELQVTDLDRSYYNTHGLTIARHPSETDQRMMVRVLAFALHAHEALAFTRGLSQTDEPDLWHKNPDGRILDWIELGQPNPKRIRKACARAERVSVYAYQARAAQIWWLQSAADLERFDNLRVHLIPAPGNDRLAGLARRNMALQFTRQDGQIWLSDMDTTVEVTLEQLVA